MSVLGTPGLNNFSPMDIESLQIISNTGSASKKVAVVATTLFSVASFGFMVYGGYCVHEGLNNNNISQCVEGALVLGINGITSFISGLGAGWLVSHGGRHGEQ
jgi:hypothetical protein